MEVILKSGGTKHELMHGSENINDKSILNHLNNENQDNENESTTTKGLRRREPNRHSITFKRLKGALENATKKKRRKNESINQDH